MISAHRGVAIVFATALLAACSTPTGVKFTPSPTDVQSIEPVLVATSRSPMQNADYSGDRDAKLHLASYQVSIPKSHKVGQIEWPRNKPDPKRHFAVASVDPFDDPKAYQARLGTMAAEASAKTGKRPSFGRLVRAWL